MEVSTAPCDTGTPLDRLQEEFPQIHFQEELFPDVWPRSRDTPLVKENTIYDDFPELLWRRSQRVLEYVKNFDDMEIIIVTHGSFAHRLFNLWMGQPGDSNSGGTQLGDGKARPMTLPGKTLDGAELQETGEWVHIGPQYPKEGSSLDASDEVLQGPKDYGAFTAITFTADL